MRLREIPILHITWSSFYYLIKSNPEKYLAIQEEVKLIINRLDFLTDLLEGVEIDLMSKSERINLREILDLVESKQ